MRCGSVESTGVDPERALLALRERTKATMNLAHDLASMAAWASAVRGLDGQGHTLAAYETLGEWIAAGGFGWWTQGRPTLAFLLRPGKLAEVLAEAADWSRLGRPMIRRGGASHGRDGRRRLGPAPPATAAEHAASMLEEDPLIALLG